MQWHSEIKTQRHFCNNTLLGLLTPEYKYILQFSVWLLQKRAHRAVPCKLLRKGFECSIWFWSNLLCVAGPKGLWPQRSGRECSFTLVSQCFPWKFVAPNWPCHPLVLVFPYPFWKRASCSPNYCWSVLGNIMSSFDFLMAAETVKMFFFFSFFFYLVNVIIVKDEDSNLENTL